MKRFFLIDVISGQKLGVNDKKATVDDRKPKKFHDQFGQINYAKSIELRFVISDEATEMNRINIPLLIIEYETLNLTKIASGLESLLQANNEDQQYNIDFSFKIKFLRQSNLMFFFQIVLPTFLCFAFFYSLMQTYFFKARQQKIEYDFELLLNFVINVVANISNAIFALVLIFLCYVFFIYKAQREHVKIILPLKREEEIVRKLLSLALAFKVIFGISL